MVGDNLFNMQVIHHRLTPANKLIMSVVDTFLLERSLGTGPRSECMVGTLVTLTL